MSDFSLQVAIGQSIGAAGLGTVGTAVAGTVGGVAGAVAEKKFVRRMI